MNSSIYKFLLDLQSTQSQIALPVTRGDTARVFLIRLADGGLPYTIVDGILAKIDIKRPTGTHISHFCAVENNRTIRYDFSQNENTAAVEGVHDCEVILYNSEGEKVASARFTMIVSDRVVNSDDIVLSDDDFTAVDAMLAEEAKRQIDETERISAEAIRISNEEKRVAAEEARIEAEKDRKQSELDRKTFETLRLEDEKKRKSDETARNNAEAARKRAEDARSLAESGRSTAETIRNNDHERRQTELNAALVRVEGLESRISVAFGEYIDDVITLIGGDE
jgi:hypothetical protein